MLEGDPPWQAQGLLQFCHALSALGMQTGLMQPRLNATGPCHGAAGQSEMMSMHKPASGGWKADLYRSSMHLALLASHTNLLVVGLYLLMKPSLHNSRQIWHVHKHSSRQSPSGDCDLEGDS